MPSRLAAFLVVAALLVVLVPVVRAADEDAPDTRLLARLTDLHEAGDPGSVAEALGGVAEVYEASEDRSTKGKIVVAVGKILKDEDMAAARMAAVSTLVALDDPKVAWKQLSRAMPSRKVEEPTELDLAVVKAAGSLAQTRAIKPLMELAAKAGSKELAAAAVEALGGFHEATRQRIGILEDLLDIGRRTRPGRSTTKNVSKEAQERWAAVGPVLVKALNDLTGRQVISFEDWEALYKEYKRRPRDLFVDE